MKRKTIAILAAAALLSGCTQTAGTSAPATAGTPNPPSVTMFSSLAPAPDSVTGCILEEGLTVP